MSRLLERERLKNAAAYLRAAEEELRSIKWRKDTILKICNVVDIIQEQQQGLHETYKRVLEDEANTLHIRKELDKVRPSDIKYIKEN